MNVVRIMTGSLVLLGLIACSKDPVQHRLSKEQLAWQGYRAGEVLRFGHTQDSRVRTYQVTQVDDYMEERTGFFIGTRPEYQHITVTVQRTDTADSPRRVLELELGQPGSEGYLLAIAEWESLFAILPVEEVNKGVPIDTTVYRYPGTTFLPSATLGSVSYQQLIRVAPPQPQLPSGPGQRPIRVLYYAKGRGVVAYEEMGTGLWYRLP